MSPASLTQLLLLPRPGEPLVEPTARPLCAVGSQLRPCAEAGARAGTVRHGLSIGQSRFALDALCILHLGAVRFSKDVAALPSLP